MALSRRHRARGGRNCSGLRRCLETERTDWPCPSEGTVCHCSSTAPTILSWLPLGCLGRSQGRCRHSAAPSLTPPSHSRCPELRWMRSCDSRGRGRQTGRQVGRPLRERSVLPGTTPHGLQHAAKISTRSIHEAYKGTTRSGDELCEGWWLQPPCWSLPVAFDFVTRKQQKKLGNLRQLPCWRSEHGSERPRSMGRCWAGLSTHAPASLASLTRQQSLPDGWRERAFAAEHTLSPVICPRLPPRQRGESSRGVHG